MVAEVTEVTQGAVCREPFVQTLWWPELTGVATGQSFPPYPCPPTCMRGRRGSGVGAHSHHGDGRGDSRRHVIVTEEVTHHKTQGMFL